MIRSLLALFLSVCTTLTASFQSSDGVHTFKGTIVSATTNTLDAVVNVKAPPFNAAGTGSANDTAAIQAAFNYAWGTNNTRTELNKTIYIPPGTYKLTSTISVTNVRSARLIGGGRNNTIFRADHAGPAFQTDGLWYSRIEGIQFISTVPHTNGVFELDGNIVHDGATIGVQGNTFIDCLFHGGSFTSYALAIARRGTSWGQGSENLFLNCHFASATNAGVFINGPNALQNTFIGGNVQSCRNDGIFVSYGGAAIYSMGFQNATGGLLTQTGYDIHYGQYNNENGIVSGCRSESIQFIKSDNVPVDVYGFVGTPAGYSTWNPSQAYSLNQIVAPATANGYLFQCTVAGTSGSSEPTWLFSGTTTDGDASWIVLDRTGVHASGSFRLSKFPFVRCRFGNVNTVVDTCEFTRPDWLWPSSYNDFSNGWNGAVIINNTASAAYGVAQNGGGIVVTNKTMFNLGRQPILWSFGSGGGNYSDVGLLRNDGARASGTEYADSKNVLGVIGSLGKLSSENPIGDDFVIVGGLGAESGGAIRMMTQPSGSTSAVTRVTIANDGVVTLAGTLAAAGFLAGSLAGITTTWTNMIPNVITQRISTIGGIVVTNLTL